MSASTASSAGRFAWMSEMRAYRISAYAEAKRHHRSTRGACGMKLLRRLDLFRHVAAFDFRESETREIMLGRRRQQIERIEAARLRLADRALHELPSHS